MQRNYYSFVFRPSQEVMDNVADMRSKLGDTGKNQNDSEASVGIMEFEANESELPYFKEYAAKFASVCTSQTVEFTSLDAISPSPGRDNGVLYFAASKSNQPYFRSMMDAFYADFPMKDQIWAYLSQKPYITLARGLSKNRLLTAKNYFTGIRSLKLRFECGSITLRQFDPATQQFLILQDYVFGMSPQVVPSSVSGNIISASGKL
ncbi:hypothetical protein [Flavobacterium silvaticum]|uniref:Uncharacterized protein n=1 Tax=Flavobacterium silvaticum TaxID=1852020 RepID=A0A972JFP7_9FLAO|nr:hypothetical protein [Flavobacterium silvaticum]NMH28199.1 hypothetical protein [Flavobacterium silvaticum]